MKLLSSPSISSSSTVSIDPKICTPKSATAGCLSGILRRMLCSRTLPTHPSNHITEANSVADSNNKQELDDASKFTPGLVARLMGLDSLPELNPNSFTRSRSMNSADYKEDTASIHGKHRRVNSALSLRDMPTYFELENEDFFVLSFQKGSGKKEQRSKERKCRDKEKKKRDDDEQANKRVLNVLDEEKLNRRIVEKPIEGINKCREVNDVCLYKKGSVADGAKPRKKRKKSHQTGTQNVELAECSSEDSSPVSVLVFDQFIIDHDVPTSEEDSKRAEELNPRRKLSPDLENYGCKSPCNDSNLMEDVLRENNIEVKNLESKKKEWHGEKNFEVFDAICRVIESEIAKSSWLSSKNEEFEDVTADFGSTILDQLLDELVIQLSGI